MKDSQMLTVYTSEFRPTNQPQPFPLQGSKRGQVPVITSRIPGGSPRLIEPFCGSAAVAVGARWRGLVEEVNISDANKALAELWSDILNVPFSLSDRYEAVWLKQFEIDGSDPKSYFAKVRDRHNLSSATDTADFLFLLNRIVKGSLRYNRQGAMNQSADGRRVGAKPKTVRSRICETSKVMDGASISHQDWMDALRIAEVDDIVYLDPPYQGTSDVRDQRYISGLTVDAFESGLKSVVERGLSAIISYDALRGPAIYGRPLSESLNLLALDVVTGVSAQGTLLGRRREAHETIYLTPALVERLGGRTGVSHRVAAGLSMQTALVMVG